jgi:lysyl-tRNA synthetase class I
MKKVLLFIMAFALAQITYGQAYTANAEFLKIQRAAVLLDVPFNEGLSRAAIEDRMKQQGYKGKEQKGFMVYKGVVNDKLGLQPYDLYFMVDKKSKRDKDNSIVTLLISKGIDDFATATDTELLENAKNYLNGFKAVIDAYDLEVRIKEQEKEFESAERKRDKLVEQGQDLAKDKTKIERKIDDNAKEQTAQKNEVEKQRQILEKLKLTRKL